MMMGDSSAVAAASSSRWCAWGGGLVHTAALIDGVTYHGQCARRRGAVMGETVQRQSPPAVAEPRPRPWIVAIGRWRDALPLDNE